MLIVGDNLKELMEQYEIISDENCYDNNCLSLSLDKSIIRLVSDGADKPTLIYGDPIPDKYIKKQTIGGNGIVIPPKSSILAASSERVKIPLGYYGFIQTKGTLARYCVSVHFCDGQIDSGYQGKVTFEIFNGSDFNIKIHKSQKVANLYIFKTSSKNSPEYSGVYSGAKGPTLAIEH